MVSSHEKLEQAVVGIAGLGGLGSTVAVALARAGVGRLIIADFDMVEQGNLSRQQYFIDQVGKNKVDCVTENLQRINPGVQVRGHHADVIAECFDAAEEKRMIVETVLGRMDRPIVVTVSGLAGYGNSNAIQTQRISERLILVGDGESGVDSGKILTATRVGIAACHQANAIIEVLIDEIKN
jgi:sulfur carrier protein ThiS adenylyltransferase